jgi:nickel-dependent lactate racemase
VPSAKTLPPLLAEIRRGAPDAKITVLIATGCHRGSTGAEIRAKFGAEFAARETIVNHNSEDEAELLNIGTLPSGGELIINRRAAVADLLVADGFIEPHQFAGFSGGRKSVLPGIASRRTVLASHNAEFTVHPKAIPGSLDGNPFHADMTAAARMAKLAFILNVVLSPEKKVIAGFAGNFEKAHRAGCDLVTKLYGVDSVRSPIVRTSNGGYPLDQNIYQATKSVMAGDLVCATGGIIIACNQCRDGHGGEGFFGAFRDTPSLEALIADIASRDRNHTQNDQWATQLVAGILAKRRVFFVTEAPREMVETLYMKHFSTLEDALAAADSELAHTCGTSDSPITILPEAVSLVIRNS